MELYFVINAIFRFFEKEVEKLKNIYFNVVCAEFGGGGIMNRNDMLVYILQTIIR